MAGKHPVILLGTNRFTRCQAMIRIKSHVVLRVEANPLRVDLSTPGGLPGVRKIRVETDASLAEPKKASPGCFAVVQPSSITIVFDGQPLLFATQTDPKTVHIRMDLRPLGVAVYDDASGLHLGASTLAHNEFVDCATAIALS